MPRNNPAKLPTPKSKPDLKPVNPASLPQTTTVLPQQTHSPFQPIKHHPRLVLLVMTLIIASLGTLGFLYYQNIQLNQEVLLSQFTQTVTQPKSSTQTTDTEQTLDPLSNWQTYTHPSYNFSFQYPPNYQVETAGDYIISLSQSATPSAAIGEPDITISVNQTQFDFDYIYSTPNNTTIPQESTPTLNFTKLSSQTIDSYPAFKYQNLLLNPEDNQDNLSQYGAVINVNNNLIKIYTPDASNQILYNLILSTFKFTEPNTNNWTTYKNDLFQFQYPTEMEILSNPSLNNQLTLTPKQLSLVDNQDFNVTIDTETVPTNTVLSEWIVAKYATSGTNSQSAITRKIELFQTTLLGGYSYNTNTGSESRHISFKQDDQIVTFSLPLGTTATDNATAQKYLFQILSTFEFNQ